MKCLSHLKSSRWTNGTQTKTSDHVITRSLQERPVTDAGKRNGRKTWVDIAFSPDNGYHLTKGIRKAEKALKKKKKHELDTFEKRKSEH